MTEEKETKYMLGIYDCIFKAIMLNKDNIEYLKKLIHMITKIPLSALDDIKIENVEHIKENKKDKNMQSDIIVSVDNLILNLEMNKDSYEGLFNKNDAYLYKIASNEYNDARQVIQINFNNFDYFKKGKEIYCFEYKEKDTNIKLEDNPIKYYVDLSFIKKKCYNNDEFNKANEFEKYCLILMEESDKEMKKIVGDDEVLKKVTKNIEKLNENKSIVVWYDAEKEAEKVRRTQNKYFEQVGLKKGMKKGMKQGIKQGIEQGIQEGINQTKIELAKKMIVKGMPISEISEITGLQASEIEKLR